MTADVPDTDVPLRIADSNNRFAFDLYGQLRNRKGNLFFSPYSISTALAMVYAGAGGRTADQLASALHLPAEPESIHPAFGDQQAQLNALGAEGDIALNLANGLWAQQDYPFLEPFLELVEKHYGAELRQVDFKTAHEIVRQEINAWVEQQTHDKIRELLKPGVLNALTRLVLVNAIYFKGDWAHPFEESATQEADFFITATRKTPVPLMTRQQRLGYMENDLLQAVALPYAGDALSLVALLPKRADGLAELETSLNAEALDQWLGLLQAREVQVFLPRFKTTSEFNLVSTLSALGVKDAFVPGAADLSSMDGSRELSVSSVVHKAFVDVNEEGTEAAAATGAVVSVTSMPASPIVFRADRPFLFLIRDERSEAILFMGRFAEPEPAAD
jgi:serpin B